MALTDENGMVMPVAPMYGGNNGGMFGGDWGWIVLLLLFAGGWGNGFGGGYNNALGYDFPWLLNGQQAINANTNAGFDTAMISGGITSIRDGIAGLSTQMCNGFATTNATINSGFASAEQGANTRQMANMNQMFGLSTQLADCCCENRLATNDLKYTIATEACANRATSTANTQAILDKLCQLELDNYKTQLDNKNDTIAQLRSEILYARGQASQDVQTAEIRANNATVANQLLAEMRSCPIPAQPVYGSQPIFTCGGTGCGCGNL